MNRLLGSLAILFFASAALAGPKGTEPRSSPAQYPLHAQRDAVSIGAKLLTREEARKTFVSDVNSCCTIIEVAVYPDTAKPINLSLNDFVLRARNTESAAKPSTPKVAAASIQKNTKSGTDVAVYPTTSIGYSSGSVYDPATGTRQGSGVYTQTGVGVAIGSPNGPGISDKDRSVMETELSEKAIPEGTASSAVAGYVYFPIFLKKKGEYQLEYTVEGQKLILPIRVD